MWIFKIFPLRPVSNSILILIVNNNKFVFWSSKPFGTNCSWTLAVFGKRQVPHGPHRRHTTGYIIIPILFIV